MPKCRKVEVPITQRFPKLLEQPIRINFPRYEADYCGIKETFEALSKE